MNNKKVERSIFEYLKSVESLQSESAKSHRFLLLLNELFGIQPGFIDEYVSGIEKYIKVKQKDRILKGKVDNLYGNLVIEFERDLVKMQSEAEEQLKKYVACLWSQEIHGRLTPYICISSDGIRFVIYSPKIKGSNQIEIHPDDVDLSLIEKVDLSALKEREVYFWLDRYFLRKELLSPKTGNIIRDFGIQSHAFQFADAFLVSLWQSNKEKPEFRVVYESWDKYLHIVYGTSVGEDELFCRHTYLATLAKLMAWQRLAERKDSPDDTQILSVLEGQFFKKQGIENFLEEDFFSWIVRKDAKEEGIKLARMILSLLLNYNLSELSEDLFKSLYQELVDPKTRHDLGEFYTPDWLAHRIVRKMINKIPRGSLFDPACGSGTFLYIAIREKRKSLPDSTKTLDYILSSIYGADIHPLAVIVAKTNYVLALGNLLKKRKGSLTIPIYLADTIRLPTREIEPTLWMKLPSYRVELAGSIIHIPEQLIEDTELYDQAIELAKEFSRQNKKKPITIAQFCNFLVAQHFPLSDKDELIQAIFSIAESLKHFIDNDRDTIWAFVLKNLYKPLFFKHKFDIIIGNPPWIAFHFMEPEYQVFLKQQIIKEYKLLTGRGELITHLEVATFFFVRAAELYLKKEGIITFVLPRSIFSADQHDGFRKRRFKFSESKDQNLFWQEIWDCENVKPLFNIPSCVLIAEKSKMASLKYPIPGQVLSGKLERKNESLVEAEKVLKVDDVEFSLQIRGMRSFWTKEKEVKTKEASFYKACFAQGATIVPRSFWFVQVKPSPLGFNPDLPSLETDPRAIKKAKKPYQNIKFEGNIESQFLYASLLSTDLLPFGQLNYRLVVLPVEPKGNHHILITVDVARQRGFLYLSRWLEKAEREWKIRRGAKAERMSIYERLDRLHGLTIQNPYVRYRVVYPLAATYLCAAVLKTNKITFSIEGQTVNTRGILIDHALYSLETNNKQEAYYLTAVLNSPEIDKQIKPMQARGLWGPHDIHKKVLELPIPKFDDTNPCHLKLASFGKECSSRVKNWLREGGPNQIKSIGRLRGMVRKMIKDELKEIDSLVKGILG